VVAGPGPFSGGAFDGRYVYFAPALDGLVLRVDVTLPFNRAASWSAFDVASLSDAGPLGGFSGAVFDGRYVYFVPHALAGAPTSLVARFDTAGGALSDPTRWSTFDLASYAASGFSGGTTDGRFVYFVPNANAAGPDGRVVRYQVPAGSDAAAAPFDSPGAWSTFDMPTLNSAAAGFVGAAYDGKSVYFVPFQNGGLGDNGYSGIAMRLRANANIDASASWTPIDMTTINGEAFGFSGAVFDGRYVYFIPRQRGIAMRLDTTATQTSSTASWQTYDLRRLEAFDGGFGGFGGGAFDGRYVYYVPTTPGFGNVVRYDTMSTFGADCAWSSVDISQQGPLASGYFGAVFDGEYIYFVPRSSGLVARFDARMPPSLPALPAFHGSFY
jgi:hypothetical protein